MQYAIMLENSKQLPLMKRLKRSLLSGTGVVAIITRHIFAASRAERIATFFDLPGRSLLVNSSPLLGLVKSNWRFMLYQGRRSLVVRCSNQRYLILDLQTGSIKYGKSS
jgi:hypothetical protein